MKLPRRNFLHLAAGAAARQTRPMTLASSSSNTLRNGTRSGHARASWDFTEMRRFAKVYQEFSQQYAVARARARWSLSENPTKLHFQEIWKPRASPPTTPSMERLPRALETRRP